MGKREGRSSSRKWKKAKKKEEILILSLFSSSYMNSYSFFKTLFRKHHLPGEAFFKLQWNILRIFYEYLHVSATKNESLSYCIWQMLYQMSPVKTGSSIKTKTGLTYLCGNIAWCLINAGRVDTCVQSKSQMMKGNKEEESRSGINHEVFPEKQ